MALLILTALVLLWAAWLLSAPWRAERRRQGTRAHPFPTAWRRILKRRVPIVRRLPAELQLQLKKRIQVFLAEKPFIGCNGLRVDDEMRVTVAAQACLLQLNREAGGFPALRQILLYPGPFVVDRPQAGAGGVQHERRHVLSGESWTQGQVILSWPDVLEGAARPDDGHNVVIHEFAHQLDQEKGAANGAPSMAGSARLARWAGVMSAEFARLNARSPHEPPPLIDPYGASDPAEFFAVVSELFFEKPRPLATEHPALYRELAAYYRVDPAQWD